MGQNILFQNKTVNGSSDKIAIEGGYQNIKATGTFDGAIITLLCDHGGDDDFAPMIEDNVIQTITISGCLNLQPFKSGMRVMATISNAGASTDLTVKII